MGRLSSQSPAAPQRRRAQPSRAAAAPTAQRPRAAAAAAGTSSATRVRATTTGPATPMLLLLVLVVAVAPTAAFLLPWAPTSPPLSQPQKLQSPRAASWGGASQQRQQRGTVTRRYVSERQIPQYKETMQLYQYDGDPSLITPAQFDQGRDFESYLGDEKLVARPGGTPYKLVHVSKAPVFTPAECQKVIDEVEEVAAARGWTTRRHFAYPTTDVPLKELPRTMEWFRVKLQEQIYPMLATNFQECLPDPTKLRVVDAFVVKYDADGGQTSLKPHRDGSVLSFNIALNPSSEFDGGGTYFAGLQDALRIEQGHVVTHASNVLHGGHPITRGKRYILVAFVILEQYQSFAMRFANLVWNY